MKAPAIARAVNIRVNVVRGILRGESFTKYTNIPRNRASTKGRNLIAIMGVADMIKPRRTLSPLSAEAVA